LCLLFPMKGRAGVIGSHLREPSNARAQADAALPEPARTCRPGLGQPQLGALRLAQHAMEKELNQARQIQIACFRDVRVDERVGRSPSTCPALSQWRTITIWSVPGPHTLAFVIPTRWVTACRRPC